MRNVPQCDEMALVELDYASVQSMSNDLIRFSEEDLRLFSAASGDRNPLHLSPEYAGRTSYGQRVVFGALGAIACFGGMPALAGLRVSGLTADFLRPMFLDIDYRVQTTVSDGEWIAHLYDGSVLVLSLAVRAAAPVLENAVGSFAAPFFERSDAAVRDENEIVPGMVVSGRHACDSSALAALGRRWRVNGHPSVLPALSWSSYLVGMELPGRAALFFKLALEFDSPPNRAAEMNYQASVRSFDIRTRQVRMDVSIANGECRVASGECWAFTRPAMPLEEVESPQPVSDALAGRVAVVIGASRGLGAATVRALKRNGALVFSLSRSANTSTNGLSELGDATDLEVLHRLRQRVLAEQGRLDILICNACPAILPLRLEPNALGRIEDYINRAVSLAAAPLCAFLDLLNESGGCAVVISSVAAERPVREWPHYVAAKNAVEALARVAPMQYPRISSLIVRPEKLLTEMTNTPMGRRGALPPAQLAARIAERLGQSLKQGASEILS
jgi:NAD(P)-dependent dehydrogenase (short-subunit alcohol dehydrogenase family)/acyl dehydratase